MIRRDGKEDGRVIVQHVESAKPNQQHVSPSDFLPDGQIISQSMIEDILQKYQSQLTGVVDQVVDKLKHQVQIAQVQQGGQSTLTDQVSEESLRGIADAMIKMNKIDGGNIENIGKKHEIKTDKSVTKSTIDLLQGLE